MARVASDASSSSDGWLQSLSSTVASTLFHSGKWQAYNESGARVNVSGTRSISLHQFCLWAAEWFWFTVIFALCYVTATLLAFQGASSRMRHAAGFYVEKRVRLQLYVFGSAMLAANAIRLGLWVWRQPAPEGDSKQSKSVDRRPSRASTVDIELGGVQTGDTEAASYIPPDVETPYQLMQNEGANAVARPAAPEAGGSAGRRRVAFSPSS